MLNKSQRYHLKEAYFNYLRDTAVPVDKYIRTFLDQYYTLAPEIIKPLTERYRFGQSQLRPGIVRLAYELCGGADWSEAVPLCAAIQIKETAFYCIDDVLDRNVSRRLILPGLGLYSLSYAMACEAIRRLDRERAARILDELCRLDAYILQGTVLDEAMHDTDEAYYWRKVEAYNFWQHALKIGALIGGAPDEAVDLLGRIGKQIGMAYIVTNDAYDIAKEQEDFRQGKNTLPILYTLKNAPPGDRPRLEYLFGRDALLPGEATWVATTMVRCGAIDHCKKEAAKLCDCAIELLQQFDDTTARELLEFSTTFTKRNKFYTILDRYRLA